MRTQSEGLLAQMEEFFTRWIPIEAESLGRRGIRPAYSLSPGRFDRTLMLPEGMEAEAFSEAIAAYVQLIDGAMKGFVGGTLTEADMRKMTEEEIITI